MPIEELWALHGEIAKLLQTKIIAEKQELERRLTKLMAALRRESQKTERRPYPEVFPKYRNPDCADGDLVRSRQTAEWIAAQLKSGKTLDDIAIA